LTAFNSSRDDVVFIQGHVDALDGLEKEIVKPICATKYYEPGDYKKNSKAP